MFNAPYKNELIIIIMLTLKVKFLKIYFKMECVDLWQLL